MARTKKRSAKRQQTAAEAEAAEAAAKRLSTARYFDVLLKGDAPLLRLMIKRDGNPNTMIQEGYYDEYNEMSLPLICYAARSRNHATGAKMVAVLLELGADEATCDSHGLTALHYASETGNAALLEELLTPGRPLAEAYKTSAGAEARPPLYWAITNLMLGAMRVLIAHREAVGIPLPPPETLAQWLLTGDAITPFTPKGKLEGQDGPGVWALLQECGVKPGMIRVGAGSPLIYTCISDGRASLLRPLAESGVDIATHLNQSVSLPDGTSEEVPWSALAVMLDLRSTNIKYEGRPWAPATEALLDLRVPLHPRVAASLLPRQPTVPCEAGTNARLAAHIVRLHPPGTPGHALLPPDWVKRGLDKMAADNWGRRGGLVMLRLAMRA